MIKLTTCPNVFNANLLKGALENDGIPAILSNEIMCGFLGQDVDVLVKEEDFEAAKKILEQQEKNKKRPPSISPEGEGL